MVGVAEIGYSSMQSTGRPNFWIPPESWYETAAPSPTSASRLSPPRVVPRFKPPLPLPTPQRDPTPAPPVHTPSPQPARHNDRTGKEYNRHERRFEEIYNSWSQEVARLQEEHRTVSLKCRNEEETTLAMDNFNRKVQIVMTKVNEEIEALRMASSEPTSSQSENEEEEDSPAPNPARNRRFQFHQNDGSNEDEDEEEDEEDDSEEDDEEDEEDLVPGGVDPPEHAFDDEEDEEDLVPGGVDPPEHALDDEEDEEDLVPGGVDPPEHALDDDDDEEDEDRASTPLSAALAVDMSSGDDTDHSARLSRRSVKSYQSSEVSQGSLNLNTPPPTEIDEDHRATRRRQARERRKTDELVFALPQSLLSGTFRGSSPLSAAAVPRPAAMSLFENLSSSPASISSTHPSQQAGSPYGSHRPSREAPIARSSPIEVNPAAIASRIDYLRRQGITSGSNRSLSRNRQPSPTDERSLFKDQFESWKLSIQNQSEAVLKKVEKQREDVKHKFKLEQEEMHQRAKQIFIVEQERLLQTLNRNRAGSTGAASASPAVGSHLLSGSLSVPQGHGIGPSVSPMLQRAVPSPEPRSNSSAGRPLPASASQTFQHASVVSQSPRQSSPSRTWVPRNTLVSAQPGNRLSTASSSESDEADGPLENDESDARPTYQGTRPSSVPNSARGPFDTGHRRTGSQVYSGTSGASSTPRNLFPQHLRNSSSKPPSPIPIQTRPSGSNPQRQWSDTPSASGSISNASPPIPLGSTGTPPRLSPGDLNPGILPEKISWNSTATKSLPLIQPQTRRSGLAPNLHLRPNASPPRSLLAQGKGDWKSTATGKLAPPVLKPQTEQEGEAEQQVSDEEYATPGSESVKNEQTKPDEERGKVKNSVPSTMVEPTPSISRGIPMAGDSLQVETSLNVSNSGQSGSFEPCEEPRNSAPTSDVQDIFKHLPTAPDLAGKITIQSHQPIYSGSFSRVYRGEFKQGTQKVAIAIKVLNEIRGAGAKTMQRKLERERRTWGALRHPNILPLYGFVDDEEMFKPHGALVSPWYEHGDAQTYLEKHGRSLATEQRINLWKDVIAGIDHLHSHSPLLIHGDLKPRNILIDDSGNAQLCDFGLVKILADGNSGMTTTSPYTGTDRYLSRELIVGGEEVSPTTASDIYAAGCIGLEFIFSQIPYSSRKNNARGGIFADIKARLPPATCPADLTPALRFAWEQLAQCWDLDPSKRPPASSLLLQLENWKTDAENDTTHHRAGVESQVAGSIARRTVREEMLQVVMGGLVH